MNVYLDSSVVLRRFLRQAGALPSWGRWERVYASVLMRIEVLRTLDRLRLEGALDDGQRVTLSRQLQAICDSAHLVGLADDILERAAEPFSTVLGTLDALHLATALAVQRQEHVALTLLTHDARLALAARGAGLSVAGV